MAAVVGSTVRLAPPDVEARAAGAPMIVYAWTPVSTMN
jgi:hypothetical protein